MTALSAERYQTRRDGKLFNDPVAAAVTLYAGGIAVLNAAGDAQPATAAAGLVARGVVKVTVDNSAGIAGAERVETEAGVFKLANSAGGDEITRAEIGDVCYLVDDQTVAKTSSSGTRTIAGRVVDVESDGVFVDIGGEFVAERKIFLQVQALDLVGANAAVQRLVAPVAGKITAIRSVLSGALTTGDATVTAAIGGVAVTNGVITITQAGSAAGDVDSAAPTAANTVAVGNVITLTAGGANDAARTANLVVEITY